MAVVFLGHARIADWDALLALHRGTLLDLATTLGAAHYRVYRNAHDSAEVLVVAELPDPEAAQALLAGLHDTLGGLARHPGLRDSTWEPVAWDGIG